jgi:transposase InsO family protein
MKTLRLTYPIPLLCRVLEVSRSGYYAWLKRPPSKRAQEEGRLEAEIAAAHRRTRKTCGPERLQKDLIAHGIKATTDSRHRFPVAANLLEQRFEAKAPNEVWVSDLTYIHTEEGWLYCAAHKDLFNGEIVGYALGSRITKDLVERSLLRAVSAKQPPQGLIHHSDRGSQYCSPHYQKLLAQFGMKPSMSRKGNCYDNAPMESFWGTIKNELIYHCRYRTRAEAIREITEYIEIFYNRQRRQKRLGYLSPAAYERQFYAGKKMAA